MSPGLGTYKRKKESNQESNHVQEETITAKKVTKKPRFRSKSKQFALEVKFLSDLAPF